MQSWMMCSFIMLGTSLIPEETIVKLQEKDEQSGVLVSQEPRGLEAISGFLKKTFVITELEIRKLRHDYTELFTRAAQPILWLLLFGEVFTRVRAIPTGGLRYLDFMAPGIL